MLKLFGAALLFCTVMTTGPAAAQTPADGCAPSGELSFICGVPNPEDIVAVPGARSLIVSSMARGGALGGLYLVDADRKTAQPWPLASIAVRHDRNLYAACPGPLPAGRLGAHGLSVRRREAGRASLYAVNHGSREAIEVFDLTTAEGAPTLTWVGCVPMPGKLAANSVSSLPDGSILATVVFHEGQHNEDAMEGKPTGGVYMWKPGQTGFSKLAGTELAGDNGIETSPDGREFYVAATGAWSVFAFSTADPSKPLWSVKFDNMAPDNLRWSADGRLLAAGMKQNEAQCGGPLRGRNGAPMDMGCRRGYLVAAVDTQARTAATLVEGPANPVFHGVATAYLGGDTVWLGVFNGDRLAYRSAR